MKIYIVGSGGVGGYFGGKLAAADLDVTFVARGEHFKAIKKNGLQVNSIDGNFSINPAKVIDSFDKISNPDLILFTVKSYDTLSVAEQLKPVVNKNTTIITFQNGINNDLLIRTVLPDTSVHPGVAYVISAKAEPGVIAQTGGLKKLIFADRENQNQKKLKEIAKLMKKAEIDANLATDINAELWKKFIFISAFSGMTALCRKPIGVIRDNRLTRDMYEQCVNEAIDIARSLEVNLAEDIFDTVMTITDNTAAEAKSSLLIDLENNRQTEIVALNGEICRLGLENGIPTPINQTIFSVLQL